MFLSPKVHENDRRIKELAIGVKGVHNIGKYLGLPSLWGNEKKRP